MKPALLLAASLLLTLCGRAQNTIGLQVHTAASEDGYVLFAPMFGKTTYLIDKCGLEVHRWPSAYGPANSVYLLPDGQLLHTGDAGNKLFPNGGIIEKIDWAGNLTWSYSFPNPLESQHHDVYPMPNGNVLALVWEIKSRDEAIAQGRDSMQLGSYMLTEKLVELEPVGATGARVVWEWSAWDHLVQDRQSTLPNYGAIAAHPERIDLNYQGGAAPTNPDWLHANGIAYNAELDQVIISVYWLNELWIVDHSTTTAEAKTHTGGRRGKGGDLLYRWGNPKTYGRGTTNDQQLFRLHNAHWIASDKPDSGKILLFNNGQDRPGDDYSTVNVLAPVMDSLGNYVLSGNGIGPFEPRNFIWEYKAPTPTDVFAPILSGAERLNNGNTLICEATKGNFFEVDPAGTVVWKYVNPVSGIRGVMSQGDIPEGNMAFRSVQYPASYSGFNGQTLTPGAPLERNPPANYDCYPKASVSASATRSASSGFRATNPFSDRISLRADAPAGRLQLTLLDCVGAVIGSWERELSAGATLTIPVEQSLPAGMYFLRVGSAGGITTLKLRRE